MNNQSLDRVREELAKLFRTKRSKEGVFTGVKFGRRERYHWIQSSQYEKLIGSLETLLDSELQNLRQELAREIEGLKIDEFNGKKNDVRPISFPDKATIANNQAIDKVLAIIRRGK